MLQLQQLKRIVLDGGYDEEAKQQVADLEDRLQKVALAERLADNPIIKEFTDHLSLQSAQAKTLLHTDRTLTDRDRDKLFERIDVCDRFSNLFTGKERAELENTIKDFLNVVTN